MAVKQANRNNVFGMYCYLLPGGFLAHDLSKQMKSKSLDYKGP